jgi:hypothetical protein
MFSFSSYLEYRTKDKSHEPSHSECYNHREIPLDYIEQKNKLRVLSPRANSTDRATAACRRSWSQHLRIEVAMWSA